MMARGAHVEYLAHQFRQAVFAHLAGAEGLHHDGDRLGHADGIGHLHLATLAQAGGHQVLGHVAPHVGRRAVHLGGVLAGECAAAVTAHAAIGIDDDLAAGQAAVAHGAAHHETAGGVDEIAGIVIQQVGWNDLFDDLRDYPLLDLLVGHVGGVLGGDDHRVDAARLAVHVFDRDL